MSLPLVSVVTPVYNGAEYLEQAIESVLAQTYRHFEYVLLDNCSTDTTPKIIARYAAQDCRIRTHRNERLLPVIANHNAVFAKMAPESVYCRVLHADDWLAPESLEKMVEVGERHANVGIIGSLARRGDHTVGTGLATAHGCFDGRDIARRTLLGEIYPFWSPSMLMIRSEIIRERGMHYREANLHADVESCYEVLQMNDFGFVHDILTFVRVHEKSMTSVAAMPMNRVVAQNLEMLTTFGPRFLSDAEYKARLQDAIDRYYTFLARSCLEGRGREFWDFHRGALTNVHQPLSRRLLLSAVAREITAYPRASASRVVKRLIRRTRASPA